jgi:hypothetical protein
MKLAPVVVCLRRMILACLAVFLLCVFNTARADPIPPGAVACNFEAVGYSGLDGRPGLKISI